MLTSATSPQHSESSASPANPDASTANIVAGMANDAKHIGEQYLQLAKLELSSELSKINGIIIRSLIASGLIVAGALILCLGAGFALDELTGLSRGAAFLIVGLASAAAGGFLLRPKPSLDEKKKDTPHG